MDVRNIQFRPTADTTSGEIGKCSAVVNGLSIFGIRVRRTIAGEPVIAFPKAYHRGSEQTVVMPQLAEDRRQVAEAIFTELRRRKVLP